MEPRIIQNTNNQFVFEYEDMNEAPEMHTGDTFTYEGVKYRVKLHRKVFVEKVYTSIVVVAESV